MTEINSPHDFWEEVAKPDYLAFRANPSSLRDAMHAALSLFHIVDWLVEHYKEAPIRIFNCRQSQQLIDKLCTQCEDFKLLADVANAFKHFRIDRHSPSVRSATEVTSRSTSWGQGGYGEGPYGGAESVIVDLGDGRVRHFSAIVEAVFNMWDRLFRL